MWLLTILFCIISSYTILNKDLFIFGLAFLLISIFIAREHKFSKKKVITLFLIFIIFLIYKNIPINSPYNGGTLVGIVTRSSSNYIILFDGLESFYIPIKNNTVNIFSIVEVDGYAPSTFSFNAKYENAFDFQNYLNNSGIYRQIYIKMYTQKCELFPNCSAYYNNIINLFKNKKSQEIVSLIFFGKVDYSSAFYSNLKIFGISYLFSSSGIFLSFLKSKIVNFFGPKIGYKKSQIIALLFLSPILIINIDSFIVKRIITSFVINLFLHNKLKKLERISLTYITLLFDKYAIYQSGFYIPLTIVLFMNFSSLYIKGKAKYLRKFFQGILVYLIMIPFLISFNNSLNIVSFLLNIALIWLFKYQYLILYPALFFIKIPFLDEMLALEYNIFSYPGFKYFSINMPNLNYSIVVLYYIFLIILIAYKEINFAKFSRIGLAGIISILLINSSPIPNYIFNEVSFINVGQGDATYVRFKGKNYLIDTGGNVNDDLAINCLIPFLRKRNVYYLDAIFITHYDTDHYYALDSLKRNFIVKNVYDYTNIQNYNGKFPIYNINLNFSNYVEENSRSLVYRFNLSNNSFLIMGDAPIEIEKEIMRNYKSLNIDYLKVGHHGSNTSSSLEFLRFVSPKEAIISCGINNIYKHPHKEVISNLNELNIKIRRTDKEGTISYIFYR